ADDSLGKLYGQLIFRLPGGFHGSWTLKPGQQRLRELAHVALQLRFAHQVTRQVVVDQDHVPVNHSGQSLKTQADADGDDQEGEDRPHIPPQPGVRRQEEVREEDRDQQGPKDGFEPLEQVEARGRDDEHEGQSAQADEARSAAQDRPRGRGLGIHVDRIRPRNRSTSIGDSGIDRVQDSYPPADGRVSLCRGPFTGNPATGWIHEPNSGSRSVSRKLSRAAARGRMIPGCAASRRGVLRPPFKGRGAPCPSSAVDLPTIKPTSCPNAPAVARANWTRSMTSGPTT